MDKAKGRIVRCALLIALLLFSAVRPPFAAAEESVMSGEGAIAGVVFESFDGEAEPAPKEGLEPQRMANARLTLHTLPEEGASIDCAETPPLETHTNDAGEYAFSNLAPGRYAVSLDMDSLADGWRMYDENGVTHANPVLVTIEDDETTRATFPLHRPLGGNGGGNVTIFLPAVYRP